MNRLRPQLLIEKGNVIPLFELMKLNLFELHLLQDRMYDYQRLIIKQGVETQENLVILHLNAIERIIATKDKKTSNRWL